VLDTTFSGDGLATPDIWTGADRAFGLAVAPGGKVVAGGVGGSSGVLARIIDYRPAVTVTAPDGAAGEAGQDRGVFRISRGPAVGFGTRVYFSVGGTAALGSDYTLAVLGGTGGAGVGYVDIPAGAAFVDVVVTPVDDTVVEGIESVSLTLKPSATYTPGGTTTALIGIADNDV
jgi:hypothetical protein